MNLDLDTDDNDTGHEAIRNNQNNLTKEQKVKKEYAYQKHFNASGKAPGQHSYGNVDWDQIAKALPTSKKDPNEIKQRNSLWG